jgi:serine phosphatase RsbU (regulator of sigma subunit)
MHTPLESTTTHREIEERKSPLANFWRELFQSVPFRSSSESASESKNNQTVATPADPLHCDTPVLHQAEIAAVYSGQRIAGDFYEFLRVGPSRMLFVLLDIAGLRAETREILIAVQKTFRTLAPDLFAREDFNETNAMIKLCHAMNRTIMRDRLRSCPGFIGCYNQELGTVCYANAGHIPGLLRDKSGITLLGATGLPLGLFSHATQSAAVCHLVPGAALLVVSRGIIEADCSDPNRLKSDDTDAEDQSSEFGLEGVKKSLQNADLSSAHGLCTTVLQDAREFTATPSTQNDLTTLALLRNGNAAREF